MTVAVTKSTQAIGFGALGDEAPNSPPFTLAATAGGSSASVVFSSSTLAKCTVVGSTVTLLAAGTCTINANQQGDDDYLGAPQVSQSFQIVKIAQTITFPPIAAFDWKTGSATLTATASSQLAVTSGACSLSGSVLSSALPGTCEVTASQAGDATYAAATAIAQSVVVAKAAQTITFPAITSFGWQSGSATLAATASSGLVVTYSVTSGPCTLTGAVLTASTGGSCDVTASQGGTTAYLAASDSAQSVVVTKAAQAITFPAVSSFEWKSGAPTLAATSSSALAVTYSVASGPCMVTGSVLTASTAGTCVVTASQTGDTGYLSATDVSQNIVVRKAPQTVTFPSLSSFVWKSGSASLAVTTSSALVVAYSVTSGPSTVTGSVLTASTAGECEVTASPVGDSSYLPALAVKQAVVVTKAAQAVTFAALANKATTDAPLILSATGGASSQPFVFSSGSTACSLCGPTVTLVGAGTCTIAMNQAGDAQYEAAAEVRQAFTVSLAAQTISFEPIAPFDFAGGSSALEATSSSGLPQTFSVISVPRP